MGANYTHENIVNKSEQMMVRIAPPYFVKQVTKKGLEWDL